MPGKQEAFSDAENRALRTALRKLQADRELSQAELGKILGIKQQNAGRLVRAGSNVGMGRGTANALAKHLGFRDHEHLLLELGVAAILSEPPAQHPSSNRESAVRIARYQGYSEAVINAVVHRETSPSALAKGLVWWAERFAIERISQAADDDTHAFAAPKTPEPSESERSVVPSQTQTKQPKRRKKTG